MITFIVFTFFGNFFSSRTKKNLVIFNQLTDKPVRFALIGNFNRNELMLKVQTK